MNEDNLREVKVRGSANCKSLHKKQEKNRKKEENSLKNLMEFFLSKKFFQIPFPAMFLRNNLSYSFPQILGQELEKPVL